MKKAKMEIILWKGYDVVGIWSVPVDPRVLDGLELAHIQSTKEGMYSIKLDMPPAPAGYAHIWTSFTLIVEGNKSWFASAMRRVVKAIREWVGNRLARVARRLRLWPCYKRDKDVPVCGMSLAIKIMAAIDRIRGW